MNIKTFILICINLPSKNSIEFSGNFTSMVDQPSGSFNSFNKGARSTKNRDKSRHKKNMSQFTFDQNMSGGMNSTGRFENMHQYNNSNVSSQPSNP